MALACLLVVGSVGNAPQTDPNTHKRASPQDPRRNQCPRHQPCARVVLTGSARMLVPASHDLTLDRAEKHLIELEDADASLCESATPTR